MTITKYIRIAPWRVWRWMLRRGYPSSRFGLFRNLPHVKPGRWGFFLLGFEVGSRDPQDGIGLWLRQNGLFPW